ncbi:MAG: hypothetical protein PHO15_05810 [Eubacteriales bacterium]|nr:hypothetical protein [Eubacteriales bacterium]
MKYNIGDRVALNPEHNTITGSFFNGKGEVIYNIGAFCLPEYALELTEKAPMYRKEKRHAKQGERIRIVSAHATYEDYKNGDEFVVNVVSDGIIYDYGVEDGAYIFPSEYVVLVPVESPASGFRVGAKARITRNSNNHCFTIGETVTLYEKRPGSDRWYGESETDKSHFSNIIRESDMELLPDAVPAEPIARMYCTKDYEEGKRFIKGKVYTIDADGYVRSDGGYKSFGRYNSFEYFSEHNPTLSACLVPMVKREPLEGEYIYIVKEGRHDPPLNIGDILRVEEVPTNGLVVTKDNCFDPSECDEFLLLDGYKPEPEYWSGKVFCAETNNIKLTERKIYNIENGIFKWDDGIEAEFIFDSFDSFEKYFSFVRTKWYEVKGNA